MWHRKRKCKASFSFVVLTIFHILCIKDVVVVVESSICKISPILCFFFLSPSCSETRLHENMFSHTTKLKGSCSFGCFFSSNAMLFFLWCVLFMLLLLLPSLCWTRPDPTSTPHPPLFPNSDCRHRTHSKIGSSMSNPSNHPIQVPRKKKRDRSSSVYASLAKPRRRGEDGKVTVAKNAGKSLSGKDASLATVSSLVPSACIAEYDKTTEECRHIAVWEDEKKGTSDKTKKEAGTKVLVS